MRRLFFVGVVVATAVIAAPPPTNALTHDKLAIMSFSAPVQIPGVTLAAGTYRFRLTNPDTSRNVLQVLSNDGKTVYAMFHTIPEFRSEVTYEEPVLTFMETPAGVPPAAKTLFYSHESIGYTFVYPKGGPNMTAEVWAQPEITYAPAPAPAAEPILEEPPAEAVAEEPAIEPALETVPQPAQVELPRTATPLPWIALGGMTSLVAGLGIRRRRTR
jgi:hypothetical protein